MTLRFGDGSSIEGIAMVRPSTPLIVNANRHEQ